MNFSSMPSEKHPLWAFLRLVVLMTALVAVLYMNASHFDKTELTAIIQYFIAAASVEGGITALMRLKGKE